MVFTNKELKNMAYRSANLGMRPRQDFILDEKKIINGWKTKEKIKDIVILECSWVERTKGALNTIDLPEGINHPCMKI